MEREREGARAEGEGERERRREGGREGGREREREKVSMCVCCSEHCLLHNHCSRNVRHVISEPNPARSVLQLRGRGRFWGCTQWEVAVYSAGCVM